MRLEGMEQTGQWGSLSESLWRAVHYGFTSANWRGPRASVLSTRDGKLSPVHGKSGFCRSVSQVSSPVCGWPGNGTVVDLWLPYYFSPRLSAPHSDLLIFIRFGSHLSRTIFIIWHALDCFAFLTEF